jgi:hypothetical protein
MTHVKTTYVDADWVAVALRGRRVVDIGQISPQQRRLLDAAARRGELIAYRDYWYPGMGRPKRCWANLKSEQGRQDYALRTYWE